MTSLFDTSSSPDPLGDEAPSSLRPVTRRAAGHLKSHQREPSLQLPSSIRPARPISTGKSPRKQTFELDVGNGRSPQRLLVTVEAEEERGRSSGVSRRLFTASPSRSVSRRRGTTKTTVVPLRGLSDDEGADLGDENIPRRRGRPRVSLGSKNGTPAPRGKKRAGTPLQKQSRAKRQSAEATSDAPLPSDAAVDASMTVATEPTPKPKTRTRKTPKKAGTPAVPSSKPTGRKRGRPRKALLPDEVAGLTSEAGHQIDGANVKPNEDVPIIDEPTPENNRRLDDEETILGSAGAQGGAIVSAKSPTPEDTIRGFASRSELRRSSAPSHYPDSIHEGSAHEARLDDFDEPMFDDFVGEAHSDLESEFDGADGMTYSGQDNLTHASDFSMIAVEGLPSFQASLNSNRGGLLEEEPRYSDAGDETNIIINQTMESLRRSTQSNAQQQSIIGNAQGQVEHGSSLQARNSPSNFGSTQFSWTRSPRRQHKLLPLSRQVFGTNRAPHVDDSFSSVPDSILQAATPGRLPMKTSSAHVADDDSNLYDDSFSEVPDEVLTAATPKRTRAVTHADQDDNDDAQSSDGEAQSASRSTNIGSDRLPTPDDTNSSTTDAKNGHGEETLRMAADSSAVANTSDFNIRSSPPTISRQFNIMNAQSESAHTISRHFDTMAIQSEASQAEQSLADTPPHKDYSPQLPPTDSGSPAQAQSLQPPATSRRPTLSPIVRAGRTLQHIMSDRSSPDDHGSLGSPFRGSVQNDSRQSSVAKSPVRESSHRRAGSDSRLLFNPIASLSQSVRSAFGSSQPVAPAPAPAHTPTVALVPAPAPAEATVVDEFEDPPGSDMHNYSQTEALRRSAYGTETNKSSPQPSRVGFFPGAPSSTSAVPPSEQGYNLEVSSAAENEDPSSPATQRSRRRSVSQRSANLSVFGTRHPRMSQLHDVTNARDDDHVEDEEQLEEEEQSRHDEEQPEEEEQSQDEGHYQGEAQGNDFVDDMGNEEPVHRSPAPESEAEQLEDGSTEAPFEEEDDDIDLWDIEATRATPRSTKVLRAEVQSLRQSQTQAYVPPLASLLGPSNAPTPAAVDADPPHRSKIPSPWRRNTRRLIYQDDFRSPSEIAMEDSPRSDVQRATSAPRIAAQEEQAIRRYSYSPQRVVEENMNEDEEEHEEPSTGREVIGEVLESDNLFELMERDESHETVSPAYEAEQHKSDTSLAEHSVLQEYSMMSQFGKPMGMEQDEQEQPVPARRSLFGNFDIMSFFSSPRPPPTTNMPPRTEIDETPLHKITTKPLPRSVQSIDKSAAEEPHSALRATGLFPSIRQKIFNPSPKRRIDLFSPGTALRSNDTIADTYAETSSTPARQEYSSIPQKLNFTPLSAQSRNTASLFTPSRQGSTPAQDMRTPSPEHDNLREPGYSDEEDTILTDGPSFEMIPPREKPSQWDRTLSPIKSSLRSPIKPKTPGRVVVFTNSVLSPEAQAQVRADRQHVLNPVSIGSVNIATNNPRTAILNPSPLRIPVSYQSHDHDKENTPSPPKSPERQLVQPIKPSRSQSIAPAGLSFAAWSRAHWIRLDEILQLRIKDSMQFQMLFPSIPHGRHPLSQLEVATQDAKLVLEDWHLEVVEAFKSELVAGPKPLGENGESQNLWDTKNLSKRLFALMVGEERRRSGKYVSGQTKKGGLTKGKGKETAFSAS